MRDLVPTSTLTSPLYTANTSTAAYKVFQTQPEDGHCQGPKHVVDLYVVNSIYISTINKVVLDRTYTSF